ncbi:HoxN/HupN/NixA family nickel/cobalt transporter [Arthrobacter agilis]|uniref:HoxN/HupN/NixA family nickel/cobalt transporter n=1 Tax=Arthrobacter agilis TaxID=37921 RepID=UPI002367253A|nr:HoxN/HupN/NixA family nickel/cobalt transporter [Arthrobacter agilis]WDF33239.1 HoxN/HupN/NixA family nickel/cobalt transporter [Arthrobacter agilis]
MNRTRTSLRPLSTTRSLWGMAAVILAVHLIGWGVFAVAVLPHSYQLGDGSMVFGLGLAVTAYVLGARHAFDPDHIAAIDNATRRLTDAAVPPVSTGFWFALGHSSVVVAVVALVAAGFGGVSSQLSDDGSVLRQFAGLWGPLVSGCFLLLIGAVNLVSLAGILRSAKGLRSSTAAETELEQRLHERGIVSRFLAPVADRVDKPWKLYPLGMLFGLGLDTATTIALFVVAGGAVAVLPWHVVMVLPVLFTAGMVLCDTLDGVMMSRVYQWAFDQPGRRVFYNVVVTSVSIVIAFVVAAVVLGGLASGLLGVDAGPIAWVGSLDLEHLGYVIVAIFLVAWLGAVAVWKLARYEERSTVPAGR